MLVSDPITITHATVTETPNNVSPSSVNGNVTLSVSTPISDQLQPYYTFMVQYRSDSSVSWNNATAIHVTWTMTGPFMTVRSISRGIQYKFRVIPFRRLDGVSEAGKPSAEVTFLSSKSRKINTDLYARHQSCTNNNDDE